MEESKKIFNAAFTLAEILITLGIIGIVAAMTIPTLIQQQQNQATVVAVKNAYSILSQAYINAVQDNGTPDTWGLVSNGSAQGAANILNILAPYLKITKNCGTTDAGCFPNTNYKYLTGLSGWGNFSTGSSWVAKAILADGSLLGIVSRGSCLGDLEYCAYFWIDINGFKIPNQLGVDTFFFHITKNQGILPFGIPTDTGNSFATYCKNKSTVEGYSCAAWLIYNNNMDYLYCSDLDWDGKHQCN